MRGWRLSSMRQNGRDKAGSGLLLRTDGRRRPVRFRLDGHEYMVEEVLAQWYGPSDVSYKVRADDGNL